MTTTYYFSKVLDASLLTSANDVSTVAGASATGQDSPIGTLAGYGELCPNTAPGTWPAYASEALVPWSGKGQIYPVSLATLTIATGTWTPTIRCVVAGTSPVAITADLLVRVWRYNATYRAATKLGVCSLIGQTIGTTSTTFTFNATTLPAFSFASSEYLAFDTLANVTSNPNGAGVGAKIRANFSASAIQGNATAQIVAPDALFPAFPTPQASFMGVGAALPFVGQVTSSLYQVNGMSLLPDIPVMATTMGGTKNMLSTGTTLTLLFSSPGGATQAALANGSTVRLTFPLASGQLVTGTFLLASSLSGSMFQVTATLTKDLQISTRLVQTQFN